jgi:MoxR-like ATPase
MKIDVAYPAAAEELTLLKLGRDGIRPATLADVAVVSSAEQVLEQRAAVGRVTVTDEVLEYLSSVVRATRTQPAVELGASPRAAVHLLAAARAIAAMGGRDFVTPDDVSRMALPVLRHRILIRPEAEIERYRPEDAVRAALASVAVPR